VYAAFRYEALSLIALALGQATCVGKAEPGGAGASLRPAALGAITPISAAQLLPASPALTVFQRSTEPSAAYGAGVHLVAWKANDSYSPHAVRLSASDGSAIDPVRFPLAAIQETCGGISRRPSVAFAGQYFLVAWDANQVVCAVRVPVTGDIGTLQPLVLSQGGIYDRTAVASDGTSFLVVWPEWRPSSGLPNEVRYLHRARIRASDGALLDPAGVRLTTTPEDQRYPEIGFDGTNYLVAWRDRQAPAGLRGARIRASDGASLDPDAFVIQPSTVDDVQPALAFDGSNHLVVWSDRSRIVGTRVRASDRAILDASPVGLATLGRTTENAEPDVAHDGTGYLVLWREPTSIFQDALRARRVGGDLMPLGNVLAIADDQGVAFAPASSQALSFGAGRQLLVWTRTIPTAAGPEIVHHQQTNLVRALADGAGAVTVPAEVIARAAPWQDKPVASFDGQHHLMAWHEWNGQTLDIRAARLRDADGAVLDAPPLRLSSATATINQMVPRTAASAGMHLVVWGDRQGLRAVRVRGQDGARLDPQPIALPAVPGVWENAPRWAVAGDGSNFLVAWIEGGGGGGPPARLRGTRIRASDGAVLDAGGRALADPVSDPRYLDLAFAGSHHVVVWTDDVANGPRSLFAQRLNLDGTAAGSRVTVAAAATVGSDSPVLASVAATGDVALVAWEGTHFQQLVGRRLRVTDGALLDAADLPLTPPAIRTLSSSYRRSIISSDGEHFLVLWSTVEARHQTNRLSRLTPGGQLLDPAGVLLAPAEGWPDHDATISAGAGGRVLVGYVRYATGPSLSGDRLHWRFIGPLTPPPPDAAPPPPPDAPVVPPDAPVVPPVDAPVVVPPVDAPVVVPPVDAPVVPPVDGPAAPPADAGEAADTAEAAGSPDAGAPDGSTPTDTADTRPPETGGDAARDTVTDARSEGPGGDEEIACDCQLGGARAPAPPLAWVLGLAVVVLRRRWRQRQSGPSPARVGPTSDD
jgi:hypothetical protein